MLYPRFIAVALLAGSMGLGAYAWAQGAGTTAPAGPAAPAATATTPAADALPLPALLDKLTAQGYRDISEVERKGDRKVEVKAIAPDGRRKELYVDARTGEILKVEND